MSFLSLTVYDVRVSLKWLIPSAKFFFCMFGLQSCVVSGNFSAEGYPEEQNLDAGFNLDAINREGGLGDAFSIDVIQSGDSIVTTDAVSLDTMVMGDTGGPGAGGTGAACADNAACMVGQCLMGAPFPGGYCSRVNVACSGGELRVGFNTSSGMITACLLVCSTPSQCRSGYQCTLLQGAPSSVCIVP